MISQPVCKCQILDMSQDVLIGMTYCRGSSARATAPAKNDVTRVCVEDSNTKIQTLKFSLVSCELIVYH